MSGQVESFAFVLVSLELVNQCLVHIFLPIMDNMLLQKNVVGSIML